VIRGTRISLLAAAAVTAAACGAGQSAAAAESKTAREYVVVYETGVSGAAARAAVARAGGTVVAENRKVGVATVRSAERDFAARATRAGAILGTVANRAIGRIPTDKPRPGRPELDPAGPQDRAGAAAPQAAAGEEPLAGRQWDMRMIGATVDGSYARQRGNRGVRVGILDSGVDASHPDIAPNFNRALSRNFVTDLPDIDGPCEEEPDRSCSDPPDVDENGHGTHVAGTVAAAFNGVGIAGVAPRVDLVSIRTDQESGFVFLQPVLDGLTYAADHGVDVVNMSWSVDPWWWNCPANPADSPEAQAEQRAIIAALQRGLDYARSRDVTLIASLGNFATDMGRPTFDDLSPAYPLGREYPRQLDNTCLMIPAESEGVIGVSSLGPSGRKSYFSNYGIEQTDLSAPGGDGRDPVMPAPTGRVLSPHPAAVGRVEEQNPALAPLLVKDDRGNYWRYRHGTSMAAPHVVGVAALAVAQFGKRDPRHGGLTMRPGTVESILRLTSVNTPCPDPPLFDYPEPETGPEFNALCEGASDRNGFYGDGIVSAINVVGG
jgi:subtilisin family serine protease